MEFARMLDAFAGAVEGNDGPALAALFTPDGVYDDGFFGPQAGHQAIIAMLQHFHEGGTRYRWEFFAPLAGEHVAYASYRFSYVSRMAGSEGRAVLFTGMSRFDLSGGLIHRYSEVFDRGVALVQQEFAAERIKRILQKMAARQNEDPLCRAALGRLQQPG
jgi:hypothetical protein